MVKKKKAGCSKTLAVHFWPVSTYHLPLFIQLCDTDNLLSSTANVQLARHLLEPVRELGIIGEI